MSIVFNDNQEFRVNKFADNRQGGNAPWPSIAAALAGIEYDYRVKGLLVCVESEGIAVYYIFKNGIEDEDLELFSNDPFGLLTISSSAVSWDTSTGLQKKVTASADFTLNISNLINGMSGALTINAMDTLTITLATGHSNAGNGDLSITTGLWVLAFIFDDDVFFYNIAEYA